MEDLNINLSGKELTDMVKEMIANSIKNSLQTNKGLIEKTIESYFKKEFFSNQQSIFEKSLDWAVESSFRSGLEEAMNELNFKELIAEKAKELLSDNNFIKDLAEQKVRASLGLPLS